MVPLIFGKPPKGGWALQGVRGQEQNPQYEDYRICRGYVWVILYTGYIGFM